MQIYKKIGTLCLLMVVIICLNSCDLQKSGTKVVDKIEVPDSSDMFTDKDSTTPNLDDSVTVDINTTITQSGTYSFMNESIGSVIIDTSDKIELILNNANITSNNFASIYVKNSDKVPK